MASTPSALTLGICSSLASFALAEGESGAPDQGASEPSAAASGTQRGMGPFTKTSYPTELIARPHGELKGPRL